MFVNAGIFMKLMNAKRIYMKIYTEFRQRALANDQLDAQIFNTYITILHMYMFRAISCSSTGGQIVLTQHLVSSLSVSDRPVHRCAPDAHLLTVTIPDAVLIQFDLLRMSKILLETCACRGL